MKPKHAYDHGASRARVLVRLHSALMDTRSRRIRSDWKTSFCRTMHWPQNAQIHRFDSADLLIVIKPRSTLAPASFAERGLADLLRAALVLGVSALDRYVHERVVKRIVPSLRSSSLTSRQEAFQIPATLALALSADLLKAQKAGKLRRPANEVRKVLQETLHKRPFQSWRELEEAFALIGITDLAQQVQSAGKLANLKLFKRQLDQIVRRRNEIVHEADLVRHQRGGKVRPRPIDPSFVHASLDFLDDLVSKLEAVK